MAKSTGPLLKRCKSLGIDPAWLGYSKKSKKNNKKNSKLILKLKKKKPNFKN